MAKLRFKRLHGTDRQNVLHWMRDQLPDIVRDNPQIKLHQIARKLYLDTGYEISSQNTAFMMNEALGCRLIGLKERIRNGQPSKRIEERKTTLIDRINSLESELKSLREEALSQQDTTVEANINALFDTVNDVNSRLSHLERELGV